jgi:catechol 2,3-dioxygenase-like lactoylglutathione lyase family enzyme
MVPVKLDHCVIHVTEWERSNAFYTRVLGAELIERPVGYAYRFGDRQLTGKSPSESKPFPPLVEARDRHTTEPPQPAPVAPSPTEAMGERRHVTVMFCDLDSAGIAAKLDTEE